MTQATSITWTFLCCTAFVLVGCQSDAADLDPPDGRQLSAEDFIDPAQAQANDPAKAEDRQGSSSNAYPPREALTEDEASETQINLPDGVAGEGRVESLKELGIEEPMIKATPTIDNDGTWVVGAMVGQVNNQAIYASHVLEPLEAVLRRYGQELSATEFRQEASELIGLRLTQMVLDKLILGEAERNLSEGERRAVEQMVDEYRAELLRKYGQGSPSLTNAVLLEDTGKSLSRTLKEHRQAVVVQRFLQMKLFPRIQVTKRLVRQHYDEDPENLYHPEVSREVRLIRVDSERDRDAILADLTNEGFMGAASNPKNMNRPDQQGRFGMLTGDSPMPHDAVNQALAELAVGEHSPIIDITLPNGKKEYWVVYVEKINQPDAVPFDSDVQVKITEKLRAERFQFLTLEYRRGLMEKGNYESINQMMEQLMQVAISRYYRAKE